MNERQAMVVDAATASDLEILKASNGGPGLLDHLDRTRTRGGRDVLRRRFLQPNVTAQAITEVQEALRYVLDNGQIFEQLPDQPTVLAITQYIESRYATLKRLAGAGVTVESLWIRWRYADLYRTAREGLTHVAAFLARMRELTIALGTAPPLLDRVAAEIWHLLESRPLDRLAADLEGRRSVRTTLLLDRAARTEAARPIRRLLELVFELDALRSMALVTREKEFTFPRIVDDGATLELSGVWHPFVTDPVGNDLAFNANERVMFVTGPNMAGKTTYLKAAGVAVLLAQIGMGVPARACTIAPFERLITGLQTHDSLRDGVSYFQAEARRVRETAVAAGAARCFVILDEPFRGTNVKDACDASETVLSAFASARDSRFLVASHLIELAPVLERSPGVVLRCFDARLNGTDVVFDYRVRAGVSGQRLGMRVLEREGVLDALSQIAADGVRHAG